MGAWLHVVKHRHVGTRLGKVKAGRAGKRIAGHRHRFNHKGGASR